MPTLEELFIRPLEGTGIPYMISGSVASIHYGEPRLTVDVDVALMLAQAHIGAVGRAFPEPDYHCPPSDVIQIEVKRTQRGHFNVIHLPTGLKADMYPSHEHPLFTWALENRRRVRSESDNLELWLAPPEYVILWKLAYYAEGGSEKHLRDMRSMLAVSGSSMDLNLVARTAIELALGSAWEACNAGT